MKAIISKLRHLDIQSIKSTHAKGLDSCCDLNKLASVSLIFPFNVDCEHYDLVSNNCHSVDCVLDTSSTLSDLLI